MEWFILGFVLGMIWSMALVSILLPRVPRIKETRNKTTPDSESEPENSEEEQKSREISEGIENLMTYEVKIGRGNRTGGQP